MFAASFILLPRGETPKSLLTKGPECDSVFPAILVNIKPLSGSANFNRARIIQHPLLLRAVAFIQHLAEWDPPSLDGHRWPGKNKINPFRDGQIS